MQYQTTITQAVTYTGVGLHSGHNVNMCLKPAPVDTGIVFVRTDLADLPKVAAVSANVTSTMRATTIELGVAKVFTIEHLLSAFHAAGIDNCYVELDNAEPPVGDGSALVFFELIKEAGTLVQHVKRNYVVIDKTYMVSEADKFVMVVPYEGFRVSFTSVNPHPLIGIQYGDYEIDQAVFQREIAPARTIAYEKEIAALKELGLGLGGTMETVIVYDDHQWLNPLRYADELVRHKILDIIGDLRLCGPIRGHVIAVKSSHALNTRLAKKISAEAQQCV